MTLSLCHDGGGEKGGSHKDLPERHSVMIGMLTFRKKLQLGRARLQSPFFPSPSKAFFYFVQCIPNSRSPATAIMSTASQVKVMSSASSQAASSSLILMPCLLLLLASCPAEVGVCLAKATQQTPPL